MSERMITLTHHMYRIRFLEGWLNFPPRRINLLMGRPKGDQLINDTNSTNKFIQMCTLHPGCLATHNITSQAAS